MGSKRTKAIWWVLVVVVVFTFVGGFIFMFGAGMDSEHAGQGQRGAGHRQRLSDHARRSTRTR